MGLFSIFLNEIEKLEKRRLYNLNSHNYDERLKILYETPMLSYDTNIKECDVVSLDFETTGLDFNKDCILSLGFVTIEKGHIDFASAKHQYINAMNKIKGNSAVINQITPEALMNGIDEYEAISSLVNFLAGKIVLCHAKIIEKSFILKALNIKNERDLPLIFLDTLKIERSLVSRYTDIKDFTLSNIRQRRNLPSYVAHNALADSVATAELFLAQIKDVFSTNTPTLKELYKRSI